MFPLCGKDTIHPGNRNAVSIALVPEYIFQRQWCVRGQFCLQSKNLLFFLELQPEYLLYWDSLYYSEHVRHVSFPVSAQEKSGVVMGGCKILLKSVVSTASLWPSLFWVTRTVSCDSSHVLSRADCIHFICWFCILMPRYLCGLVLI